MLTLFAIPFLCALIGVAYGAAHVLLRSALGAAVDFAAAKLQDRGLPRAANFVDAGAQHVPAFLALFGLCFALAYKNLLATVACSTVLAILVLAATITLLMRRAGRRAVILPSGPPDAEFATEEDLPPETRSN